MASPQQQPSMDDLPGDVISNILIRLLAKELLQMKRVSKSWNALLSQSSFVKSHLHHSIHKKDGILLVFPKENFFFDHKPFTAHPSRSSDRELTNFIKIPNLQSENTIKAFSLVLSHLARKL
uniref:F-box domain-containing protein n=1 Tax=Lactuca sativa TaxID=4236 RepID=A0A9R1WUC3_LACSA|nr:hypothetical protein LSAT_V11C800398720 [Lactuca sativa]